jgi:hypothetical protein
MLQICYNHFYVIFLLHFNIWILLFFKKNSITREEAQTPMLLLFQETKYMLEKITDPINWIDDWLDQIYAERKEKNRVK